MFSKMEEMGNIKGNENKMIKRGARPAKSKYWGFVGGRGQGKRE
jgi:hypothetical protein